MIPGVVWWISGRFGTKAGHMKSEEVHYSYFSEENGSTITTLISLKAAESLISKELTLST